MPEYTYDVNRCTSTMTIWEFTERQGKRTLCIITDVTQRKQAKRLFENYVREKQERKLN